MSLKCAETQSWIGVDFSVGAQGWLGVVGGGRRAGGGRWAVGVGEVTTLLKARVTGGEEGKGKGMIRRFGRGEGG